MNPFDYNFKPTDKMLSSMNNSRKYFKELHAWIESNVPNSRERSLALTHLQESSMWLNKAITHNTDSTPNFGSNAKSKDD